MIKIDKCPHCGSTEGFYTKDYACGVIRYRRNYDGTCGENGDMYDGLTYTSGLYAYCQSCQKRIGLIKELLP